jgi:CRP-like cAMP-binding protein
MISPEIIRRYPFFGGLSFEQIEQLALAGEEKTAETGHFFFKEGDLLEKVYLVLEGAVAIVFQLPDQAAKPSVAGQLLGEMKMKDMVVSTVGTGDVFGWSGLIPDHQATAGAKAVTSCKVAVFDCKKLLSLFEEDCRFGMVITQKAAMVIRERLRDLRIESLAFDTG